MRYAIVESGGKQYRAVEGEMIEVDRLAEETGKEISLAQVLLMADGDQFQVGTPTLSGVEVKATVVDHIQRAEGPPLQVQPQEADPSARRSSTAIHAADGRFHRRQGRGATGRQAREGARGRSRQPTAPVKSASTKASTKKTAAKKTAGTKTAAKKSTK